MGTLTVEKEWLHGKLESLGLSDKKEFVEPKCEKISIARQCEFLGLNRSSLYYKASVDENKLKIKEHIQKIFEDIPTYGHLKVHQQLLEDGFNVSVNTVQKYRQEMSLKAVLALKTPSTSLINKEHPIHTYKLKDIDVVRANQVWSTDITYIRISGDYRLVFQSSA